MDERPQVSAVATVPPARLRIGGTNLSVPYLTNKSLSTADASIRRAVVALHDHHRDASEVIRYITAAAATSGKEEETIVVAPQFLAAPDVRAHSLGADVAHWCSDGGWKQGDHSLLAMGRASSEAVSSFAVVDAIMTSLASRRTFPGLRLTVVAGHSAGGQFVQRYAAANAEPVTTRYVVANPSSYLYLDGERPVSARTNGLCDGRACTGHNRYRYGLESLNAPMSDLGAGSIRRRYRQRRVTYLLGLADNDPEHPELDRSCAARAQGAHRLERGNAYIDHLQRHYGPAVLDRHTLLHVPGVGHCGDSMFAAPAGLETLFPSLPEPR